MSDRKWQDTFPGWSKHALIIPLEVTARDDIGLGEKLTYGVLRYLSWRNNDAPVEVGVEEAAGLIGVSKRAMADYLRNLTGTQLADSKRRGLGRTNTYIVHPPYAETYDRDADSASQEMQNLHLPHAGAPIDVKQKAEINKGSKELVPTTQNRVTRQQRKRDLAFDAMAEVTDSDPQLEGSAIAKAVNALRKHDGFKQYVEAHGRDAADKKLADEIRLRAEQYRDCFPDMSLTPSALVRHWKRVQRQSASGRGMTPTQIMEHAKSLRERET